MKALAFFLAVFTSMLAVFLVATGEVKRWFSLRAGRGLVMVMHDPPHAGGAGKNMLKFDFWDFEKGRRSFTIRAELKQDDLEGGARLDELKEIRLSDGVIEIPLDSPKALAPGAAGEAKKVQEILLEFHSAVYRKEGGLTRGKGRMEVLLRDGKGTTDEGTEFHFQELLFFNDPAKGETDQFRIRSKKPVSIVSEGVFRVESPSGLEGRVKDNGVERIVFLPPVTTYLDPDAAGIFDRAPGRETIPPPGPGAAAPGEAPSGPDWVAVLCKGPLEIRSGAAARASSDGAPRKATRITFEQDVLVCSTKGHAGEALTPAARGNLFECQRLELDLDSSRSQPVLLKALATAEGGRVKLHMMRPDSSYLLEGDRLAWKNLAAREGAGLPEGENASEAELLGRPVLRGKNVHFEAERALLRLDEDRLSLERVTGTFAAAKADRGSEDSRGRAREVLESSGLGGGSDARAEDRSSSPREFDFEAEEVEVVFTTERGGERVLSHFVARGREDGEVAVRSRRPFGASGSPEARGQPFAARGRTLTYREAEKEVILEGSPGHPPRLAQGGSSIVARVIHWLPGSGVTWFERDVEARLRWDDLGRRDEEGGETAEGGNGELRADFLALDFRGEVDLKKAVARGTDADPASLHVLGGLEYRLAAKEIRWNREAQVVELAGGSGGDGRLARLEREGTVVEAGAIVFHRREMRCSLAQPVQVDLHSPSKNGGKARILAGRAEVVLFREEQSHGATTPGAGLLRGLERVRQLHAWGPDGGPLTLEGDDYRVRGREATWDALEGALRVFGEPGEQEIELRGKEVSGPVKAREIAYDARARLLVLRGDVQGLLRQAAQPAPGGGDNPEETFWELETTRLEIQLDEKAGERDGNQPRLEITSVRARDKVRLRNRSYGVQLRGDDLDYDHATRLVRVYSDDGRPQTLLHFKDAARPLLEVEDVPGSGFSEVADRIMAHEIWALLYENTGQGRPVTAARQAVLVQFRDEVMASFFVSDENLENLPPDVSRNWRLVSDRLTLHLDPSAGPNSRRFIPWAVATGNVVFQAGGYQGTGEQAIYEEAEKKLTLTGSPATLVVPLEEGRLEPYEEYVVRKAVTTGKLYITAHKKKRSPAVPWPGIPERLR